MNKIIHGKKRGGMKNMMNRCIGGVFLFVLCFARLAYAVEDSFCNVYLVQIPDEISGEDRMFNDQEKLLAENLAKQFIDVNIAAIYTSDELFAMEMASLIQQYHDVPVIGHTTLQVLAPNTLFRRVGGLKTLGLDIVDQHRGQNIVLITHESMMTFISRYVQGDFSKVSNFSYIEVSSDGQSVFRSVIKRVFG